MNIKPEQIAERDRWERLLIEGKVTLFDGLYGMLKTGAPATPYLLHRLIEAEADYNDGKVSDLAECFGIQISATDKRQLNHETLRSQVKQAVEVQKGLGFPRLNPNNEDRDSAFTKAADQLGIETPDGQDSKRLLSAQTIFDIYYDRDAAGKRIKSQLGEKKK